MMLIDSNILNKTIFPYLYINSLYTNIDLAQLTNDYFYAVLAFFQNFSDSTK